MFMKLSSTKDSHINWHKYITANYLKETTIFFSSSNSQWTCFTVRCVCVQLTFFRHLVEFISFCTRFYLKKEKKKKPFILHGIINETYWTIKQFAAIISVINTLRSLTAENLASQPKWLALRWNKRPLIFDDLMFIIVTPIARNSDPDLRIYSLWS